MFSQKKNEGLIKSDSLSEFLNTKVIRMQALTIFSLTAPQY